MDTPFRRQCILVVDDTAENIDILASILHQEYRVMAATTGKKALEIAVSSEPPDLILLDVMMPEMDGFEVCRRLKESPLTRKIPVIFVTALGEVKDESSGFACGGVDYIAKPVSPPIVRARVRTHLALYDQHQVLEKKVQERTEELKNTRLEIIRRLGRAAEFKDNETGMHVIRMSKYSHLVALAHGLPEGEADLILNAAPMHDVGKIGIPDRILLKPGPLDQQELIVMRTHCQIGYRIIGEHDSELLKAAAVVAYTHHEKWDGSGYPRGLAGKDIPLISRIVALADVFDALASRRPYKEAWPIEQVVEEIRRQSGCHFDPELVPALLEQLPKMLKIREEFRDES